MAGWAHLATMNATDWHGLGELTDRIAQLTFQDFDRTWLPMLLDEISGQRVTTRDLSKCLEAVRARYRARA